MQIYPEFSLNTTELLYSAINDTPLLRRSAQKWFDGANEVVERNNLWLQDVRFYRLSVAASGDGNYGR